MGWVKDKGSMPQFKEGGKVNIPGIEKEKPREKLQKHGGDERRAKAKKDIATGKKASWKTVYQEDLPDKPKFDKEYWPKSMRTGRYWNEKHPEISHMAQTKRYGGYKGTKYQEDIESVDKKLGLKKDYRKDPEDRESMTIEGAGDAHDARIGRNAPGWAVGDYDESKGHELKYTTDQYYWDKKKKKKKKKSKKK
jgi:hypothetical protein